MSITWPVVICAACDKPVDSLEWWEDDGGRQFLQAHCHGQKELMWVAPGELPFDVAMQIGQTPGLAFVREVTP